MFKEANSVNFQVGESVSEEKGIAIKTGIENATQEQFADVGKLSLLIEDLTHQTGLVEFTL